VISGGHGREFTNTNTNSDSDSDRGGGGGEELSHTQLVGLVCELRRSLAETEQTILQRQQTIDDMKCNNEQSKKQLDDRITGCTSKTISGARRRSVLTSVLASLRLALPVVHTGPLARRSERTADKRSQLLPRAVGSYEHYNTRTVSTGNSPSDTSGL